MTTKRLIRKNEVQEIAVDGTLVQEYFSQIIPNLGLSTATMNGTYPPKHKGAWAHNEGVDEMFYVLAGTGKIIFQDGETIELEPESAAYMPLGLKYHQCQNRAETDIVGSVEEYKHATALQVSKL